MVDPSLNDIDLKADIIKVLEILPIPNKTVLKDSKVLDAVEKWSKQKEILIVKEDEQQKKETTNGEQLMNNAIEMKEIKKTEESDDKKDTELETTEKSKDDNLTVSTTTAETASLDNQLNKKNESTPSSVSSLLKNFNIVKKDSKANQDQQQQKLRPNISAMATKLLNSWKDLKEGFRIPRLERQKRHEDEQEGILNKFYNIFNINIDYISLINFYFIMIL